MMEEFNHFPELAEKLKQAAHELVGETAHGIAKTYSETAPRKSGYMAGSVYVRTSDESTYGSIGAPPPHVTPLPEIEPPENEQTALVSVAAPYAGFLELGTRFIAPRPAFYPAVETERGRLAEKLRSFEERLR